MKKGFNIAFLILMSTISFAQTTPLEISGSGDFYYKYDFSKTANIPTSFASDQNSISLGMVDIAFKKKTGKTSFVGEISFGPRGQFQSLLNSDGTNNELGANSFHIQNLSATYEATKKLSFTAGFMGTFIGYEVISPLGNFNYSTSYLFTYGPFQNAGIKANYALSNKVGIMLGAFNDKWNSFTADSLKGLNAIGGQLSFTATKNIHGYLNFLNGSVSGTIIDLTGIFQVSDKFKLSINAADYSNAGRAGFTGMALYPIYKVNKNFDLGFRGEYFNLKKGSGDTAFKALTLSANLKSGGLTFIPEIRLDNASNSKFVDTNKLPTRTASQVAVGVVYGF